MKQLPRATQIRSTDFDAFVSEVAASIWNRLIEKPGYDALKPNDFSEIFEVVARTLQPYQGRKRLNPGKAVM